MPGLFGSTVVEVAIGLSFIFFLLSLISSSVNELLAGFLKLRARDLEKGIRNLLCDPDIAAQLLSHPIIQSMGNTRAETTPVKLGAGEQPAANAPPARTDFAGKPSYIPSRAFVSALIDTLVPGPGQSATAGDLLQRARELAGDTAKSTVDLEPQEKLGRALLSISPYITDGERALHSVDDLKLLVNQLGYATFDDTTKAGIESAKTIDEIRRYVAYLPDSEARTAILEAVSDGQKALAAFRTDAEAWFDDAMNRVSGVYKRRTQWWLLAIAGAVTLLLGADSLRLYDALATNPSLRSALVAQVERESAEGGLLDEPPPTPAPEAEATPLLDVTPEGTVTTGDDDASTEEQSDDQTGSPSTSSLLDQLHETSLPFGYDDRPRDGGTGEDWFFWALKKIVGLALTAFAAALGAPFWFDVLKKFSNLRAAGPSPAPDEKKSTGKG